MKFDIAVIGAGPVGLCFARALAGSGLRIALIERQSQAALAEPADDGREIAITHYTQHLMSELGLWARLRAEDVGILRDARVMDGDDRCGLLFRHAEGGKPQLGWLVSNCAIRRAAYAEVAGLPDVTLLAGARALGVHTDARAAVVTLEGGETLEAQLAVAADARHSKMRHSMRISASKHDFGKTMLVLRMWHEVAHEQVAWEWFGYGQTLALLPLHDPHTSSVVVTLAPTRMRELLTLNDAALGAAMAERLQQRLGAMSVAGPRCPYPLVGVYAERFVAERFALVGDAAVGMHPVTAHGFNFGLRGVATLARELHASLSTGRAYWLPEVLDRYARSHRRATRPLYLLTQMLASLYTDDHGPALLARKFALRAGARLAPFRRLVVARLTAEGPGAAWPRFLPWVTKPAATVDAD